MTTKENKDRKCNKSRWSTWLKTAILVIGFMVLTLEDCQAAEATKGYITIVEMDEDSVTSLPIVDMDQIPVTSGIIAYCIENGKFEIDGIPITSGAIGKWIENGCLSRDGIPFTSTLLEQLRID